MTTKVIFVLCAVGYLYCMTYMSKDEVGIKPLESNFSGVCHSFAKGNLLQVLNHILTIAKELSSYIRGVLNKVC